MTVYRLQSPTASPPGYGVHPPKRPKAASPPEPRGYLGQPYLATAYNTVSVVGNLEGSPFLHPCPPPATLPTLLARPSTCLLVGPLPCPALLLMHAC